MLKRPLMFVLGSAMFMAACGADDPAASVAGRDLTAPDAACDGSGSAGDGSGSGSDASCVPLPIYAGHAFQLCIGNGPGNGNMGHGPVIPDPSTGEILLAPGAQVLGQMGDVVADAGSLPGGTIELSFACEGGLAPTPAKVTFTVPSQVHGTGGGAGSAWAPNGDPNGPLPTPGSTVLPDACAGGPIRVLATVTGILAMTQAER